MTAPNSEVLRLVCISGPDQGKQVAIGSGPMTVGRTTTCHLLSDDPDVPEQFATMTLDHGRVYVQALTDVHPYVDGHPVATAGLSPGQQIRFGRSVWTLHGNGADHNALYDVMRSLGDRLTSAAGIDQPSEWNAREMFADVTKHHRDDEIEAYFTVGTAATTPSLHSIPTTWPKPWVFARVFGLTALLYIGFVYAWQEFGNENLIPGLIMIGSAAMPLSLLIFFFEANVTRNVSLYQVLKLLLIGGLVSIVIALFGFQLTNLESWLGAAAAGIIEEVGKGLALLLVVRRLRFRWTLNGLLLGATVGTGFAIFESAGYALRYAEQSGTDVMRTVITQRAILTVLGGHVLWTGLVGAALWRVRGNHPFKAEMLWDPKFLRVLAFCIAMHMIWDANIGNDWPLDIKYILLGVVAWVLVLGFIQTGLKEVREAQKVETTSMTSTA